jgi:crotonobetainyl-CoA:carnitine CoA-transferase CaiB-like acyl-CoA transferase
MDTLHDLLVVEVAKSSLGVAYAGLILGELGATVVKVEPPGGHATRRLGPFLDGDGDLDHGATFVYTDRGKQSVTLDLDHPAAPGLLAKLLAKADVILDDLDAADRERLRMTPAALAHTSAIHVSLRPFGLYGDWAAYAATPLTVSHAGGESFINPSGHEHLDRPPLKLAGHAQEYDPGSVAAMLVLAGLFEGPSAGYRYCDLSEQDVQATMVRPEIVTAFTTGVEETRATRVHEFGGPLPCSDGWVHVVIKEADQWLGLVELMGSPDWAVDPRYCTREARFEDGFMLTHMMCDWLSRQRRHDLMAKAQARGVPIVAIETPADILAAEQLASRGLFQRVPVDGRQVTAVSPLPARITPARPEGPRAPRVGEHNHAVYAGLLGLTTEELDAAVRNGLI